MRLALFAIILLCLGTAQSSLGGEILPHAYLRRSMYCAHYDYRLAYDYPWHRTNWRPTAYIGLPAMHMGVPALPPPAPPMPGSPLGARRFNAPTSARLAAPSETR